MKKVKKSKLAMRLAKKGRRGDTVLAHINPQEAALLQALGGSGGLNPNTGLPEFFGSDDETAGGGGYGDNSDQGGFGDYGGGGTGNDNSGLGLGFGQEPDTLDQVTPDGPGPIGNDWETGAQIGLDMGREARSGYVDSRGMGFNSAYDAFADGPLTGLGYGLNMAGKALSNRISDIAQNPAQYAVNLALGATPFGAVNSLSGLFGGPTLGGMAQRGYNALAYGSPLTYSTTPAVDAQKGSPAVPGAPSAPGTPTGPEMMLAGNTDPFLSQYGVPTPSLTPPAQAPQSNTMQPSDWGRLTFDPARNNYFYSGLMG